MRFGARRDLADTRCERASALCFATIRASCAQRCAEHQPRKLPPALPGILGGLLSDPCKRSAKGNFWVSFLFQGETAYDEGPFLDENPKKRFRAFPKRIAQMAAAAKVALMEAQSGEERKWGAGTGGDHSPDTLPHRTHLTVPSWTLCAHAMTRLSVMLRLRPTRSSPR